MKKITKLYAIPYYLWLGFFVILPLVVLIFQSLMTNHGFSIGNYIEFFTSDLYLKLTIKSLFYALIITFCSLIISYPLAYCLVKTKHRDLWLMLIILPTWINLLMKVYAFMGILSQNGFFGHVMQMFGLAESSLLFTTVGFIVVATYIEIPFMVLPIYTSLVNIPHELIQASQDLGAKKWQTFRYVVWPLSLSGVKSGVQAVYIPTLSMFMLTRLISGNKVITLGTAIEQNFLVTHNWGIGATIGVVLIILMFIIMRLTQGRKK